VNRADVEAWVVEYERLWRTAGTDDLDRVFTPDASYLASPWAEPVRGLDSIAEFWDAERDGPDEEFTMSSEVVAVDGSIAVVRVAVDYGGSNRSQWRDLWVLAFDGDGRCTSFEEWPFAPDRPDGQ
jgi:SnoaL-like domain